MTRLEALKKLEAAIPTGELPQEANDWLRIVWPYHDDLSQDGAAMASFAYLGNLAYAKALHKAVLPEWYFCVDSLGAAFVSLTPEAPEDQTFYGHTKDPARSLLLADIRALIAEEEQ